MDRSLRVVRVVDSVMRTLAPLPHGIDLDEMLRRVEQLYQISGELFVVARILRLRESVPHSAEKSRLRNRAVIGKQRPGVR